MNKVGLLRVPLADEVIGLDIAEMGAVYPKAALAKVSEKIAYMESVRQGSQKSKQRSE